MVERTCPAKNRISSDKIFFFFQEDSSMDLASRLIWNLSPELHAGKIQQKQFFCQIAKCTFDFLPFDNFSFQSSFYQWFCYFSVKLSWEVRWIIMFKKDAVCILEQLKNVATKTTWLEVTFLQNIEIGAYYLLRE